MVIDVSYDLYKIFCKVIHTGNMSVAAKELFISQPAVSMAIRQLEDRMGKTLLIRSPKGIKPTPEGSVLYEYLQQAMCLIETAEHKYSKMADMELGEVRIGASDTIISKYLMPYIESFVTNYPNINIKVTNRTSFETIKLLKNGIVDIGFVNLPIQEDPIISVTPCKRIHDILIGGSKYAYLSKTGISIYDLKNYPLLMLENDSKTRQYLDSIAQKHGICFNPSVELGSSELLVQFASINMGLAFVIKEFVDADNDTLFTIPVTPAIPPRNIGIVHLSGVSMSYAAQNFVNCIDSK